MNRRNFLGLAVAAVAAPHLAAAVEARAFEPKPEEPRLRRGKLLMSCDEADLHVRSAGMKAFSFQAKGVRIYGDAGPIVCPSYRWLEIDAMPGGPGMRALCERIRFEKELSEALRGKSIAEIADVIRIAPGMYRVPQPLTAQLTQHRGKPGIGTRLSITSLLDRFEPKKVIWTAGESSTGAGTYSLRAEYYVRTTGYRDIAHADIGPRHLFESVYWTRKPA